MLSGTLSVGALTLSGEWQRLPESLDRVRQAA
jgi:hypothetical protein